MISATHSMECDYASEDAGPKIHFRVTPESLRFLPLDSTLYLEIPQVPIRFMVVIFRSI